MADQVLEFVPAEATPEQWARWHRFRKRWHEASWPEDPYQPDWLEEAELKRPDPFTISQRFVRVREGEIVTAFVLQSTAPESPEYETNRHLVYVRSFVVPSTGASSESRARTGTNPLHAGR